MARFTYQKCDHQLALKKQLKPKAPSQVIFQEPDNKKNITDIMTENKRKHYIAAQTEDNL